MYPTPSICNKILYDLENKIQTAKTSEEKKCLIEEYNVKKFVFEVMMNNKRIIRKLS